MTIIMERTLDVDLTRGAVDVGTVVLQHRHYVW
jgi:hypothetical protein